ncbi:MAG: ABC transporter ATP-binding protein [Lachnospiraceae bacterium]|nr:ABC transporter ATP-binding protein [Lachnospiraceae bacterium]
MISFLHVSKTYQGNVKAVDDASFVVNPGEIVGFIGPNGSGKTTSIKIMTGILQPDAGEITIGGIDMRKHPLPAKKKIGYISDSPDQFLRLTGAEYLDFIADVYDVPLKQRRERIESLAGKFGLTDALPRQMVGYSHGMRQKMMVVGALIHDPDIWILDEPMTGLDPESAFGLKQMMREHADKGHTVLFSTHVLEVAEKLCDRVVIIRYGKILYDGRLEDLTAKMSRAQDGSLEQIFLELMKKEE